MALAKRAAVEAEFVGFGEVGGVPIDASPVMATLAADLTGVAADDPMAARWIVHLVLSMVYLPVGDGVAEREMLQRFVAPAFSGRS